MTRPDLEALLDAAIKACQAVYDAPHGSSQARTAVTSWKDATRTLAIFTHVHPVAAELACITGIEEGVDAARAELGLGTASDPNVT